MGIFTCHQKCWDYLRDIMKHKTHARNFPKINQLLKSLSTPDYITHAYSEMGIGSLIILQDVFKTDKSYLGNYLGKIVNDRKNLIKNKNVLDLGCGCGFLGILCALNDAKKICFSDINPIAVKNSKLNTMLLGIKNASFVTGDLFGNIPANNQFDVIIFNSPTILGSPSNTSEAAFLRDDELIINFFKSFPKYLRRTGIVVMPGSTRYDQNITPITLAKHHNYKYKMIDKDYEDNNNYKYVIVIENALVKKHLKKD